MKIFYPCREGTEPLGFLETPLHRRSPPQTLGATQLLIHMLEGYFAMTESVHLLESLALSDKHELTLEATCVSSEDPTPMTLAPLERLGNSSCSPVYIGLGKALASEVVTDVMMSKEGLR